MFFSSRELLKILSSTALSNGFLIVLSLLLAKFILAAEYAGFAYAVSIFAFSSLLLDFGLNISAIKRHGISESEDTPTTFASIKFILALVIMFSIIVYTVLLQKPFIHSPFLIGLVCASFNNVWLAVRVADQSNGDANSFFQANITLFILRLITVCCTYFANLPALHYLLALYVYPYFLLLPVEISLFKFKTHIRVFTENARQIFSYSKWIFLSSLLFVASAQIPLLSLGVPGKEIELATLGVAMTVASISSWLSSSLKPFIIGRYLNSDSNPGSFFKLFILLFILMLFITVFVYFAFLAVFAIKYPGVEKIGAIVFIYTSLVFIFGIYNSQIHVSGKPEFEALVNFIRILIIAGIVYFKIASLLYLVIFTGLAMVVSELLFMVINFNLKKSNVSSSIG